MAKRKKPLSPNPGLTPPSIREKIKKELGIDGSKLQNVRKPNKKKVGPLLSRPRKKSSKGPGGGGIFGTTQVSDEQRPADSKPPEISNDGRVTRTVNESLEELIAIEMNRVNEEEGVTYLRCMVRQAVEKAARGDQQSLVFIRDIISGRPGQAPHKPVRLEDVEEQIDSAEVSLLNRLLETPEQDIPDGS